MPSLIQSALPNIKAGSLRMWGEWFGKPYASSHRIVECTGDSAVLSIGFDGGEKLVIWHPEGLEVSRDTFFVRSATKVRWEWDYYGRPKLPQNRYFREFAIEGSSVFPTTNVDWYAPKFEPSLRHHAAELL
jgi:hypothetical protein